MSQQKYLVSARKYRPQRFHELVAQEHVSDTLKNAIRLDRLAHAYLFSGPRGVGKTTAARILAKAINCTTPPDERTDAAEPCRECDSCRSFEEGRNLNIIEMDAASNNKVEDIRDLRETVRIPPQGASKKVYIVDEVHMLSNAAFNALLKTLEEPPPYVLFIFATTEPNKVLPTILSRCQRFDFRRIAVPEIVGHLERICTDEHITADEASLMLLARKGDGALRDALSAFDQAVSLCGTDLRYTELAQALGVVDVDHYFSVTQHALEHDSAGMLQLVERIVRAGFDLVEFLGGMAEHLRNLLVARTMPDTDLIEATEAVRQRYATTAPHFSEADLLRMLMVIAEAEEHVKTSTQPRLKLEMALLKLATMAQTMDLRAALAQLDRLEQMAKDGTLPAALPAIQPSPAPKPAPPSAPATTEPAPLPKQEAPKQEATEPQVHEPQAPSLNPQATKPQATELQATELQATELQATELQATELQATELQAPGPKPQAPESQAIELPPLPDDEPYEEVSPYDDPDYALPAASAPARPEAPAPEPAPAKPDAPAPAPQQPPAPKVSYGNLFGAPALQKKRSEETPPQSAYSDGGVAPAPGLALTTAPDGAPADVATLDAPDASPAPATTVPAALTNTWPAVMQQIKSERIHVGSVLQHAVLERLEDTTLVLAVPDAFHQRLLESQADYIRERLEQHASVEIEQIRFVVCEIEQEQTDKETADAFDPYAYFQQKRETHEGLQSLLDTFGGEIVW